ncbi:MAG: hypothetical protein K1X28_02635 [Parachlamydiales bacterium]|nr:hypothetical protein [Parachlamydiales bacterium]
MSSPVPPVTPTLTSCGANLDDPPTLLQDVSGVSSDNRETSSPTHRAASLVLNSPLSSPGISSAMSQLRTSAGGPIKANHSALKINNLNQRSGTAISSERLRALSRITPVASPKLSRSKSGASNPHSLPSSPGASPVISPPRLKRTSSNANLEPGSPLKRQKTPPASPKNQRSLVKSNLLPDASFLSRPPSEDVEEPVSIFDSALLTPPPAAAQPYGPPASCLARAPTPKYDPATGLPIDPTASKYSSSSSCSSASWNTNPPPPIVHVHPAPSFSLPASDSVSLSGSKTIPAPPLMILTENCADSFEAYTHAIRDPQNPSYGANFVNPHKLSAWAELHPPACRKAAKVIAANVRYINHITFTDRLSHTLRSLKDQLNKVHGRFRSDLDAHVLVEGHKSNKWVAELALQNDGFQAAQYYRLGEKQARAFLQSLEAGNTKKIQQEFQGKSIVLFDDGSYSGTQICEHIRGVVEAIQKYNLQVKSIGIAVPFMTRHAFGLLQNLKAEIAHDLHIPLIIGDFFRIPTLNDLVNTHDGAPLFESTLRSMWGLEEDDLPKLGLYVFQHKVPNYQSFPDALAKGKVCDEQGNHHQNAKKDFLTYPFIDKPEQPPYKKD